MEEAKFAITLTAGLSFLTCSATLFVITIRFIRFQGKWCMPTLMICNSFICIFMAALTAYMIITNNYREAYVFTMSSVSVSIGMLVIVILPSKYDKNLEDYFKGIDEIILRERYTPEEKKYIDTIYEWITLVRILGFIQALLTLIVLILSLF